MRLYRCQFRSGPQPGTAIRSLTGRRANQRLKLTGAAILVFELQRPCRRPRQLSLGVSRLKLLGVRTPMKLSAYIITVDSGFAPNPFGRYCTLACCKPTIRRMAEKDDIVIACASSRAAKPGHLVYAMRPRDGVPLSPVFK